MTEATKDIVQNNTILDDKVVMREWEYNAHPVAIINDFKRRGREQGVDGEKVQQVIELAKNGNYQHLEKVMRANTLFAV